MSDGFEYVCEKLTDQTSVHKLRRVSSSRLPFWALLCASASLAAALYATAGTSIAIVASTTALLLFSILSLAGQRSQVLEGRLITFLCVIAFIDCFADSVVVDCLHVITQSLSLS